MAINLVLHCGANELPRADLARVPVPAATRSYNPLPYADFVNIVEDQLASIGFRFGEQSYAINKKARDHRTGELLPNVKGSKFFGIAELLNGSNSDVNALVVGLRSSLDMSIAPSIAFGSQVFVCDNLSFTGEVVIKRKQTTYGRIELPALINEAVQGVAIMRDNQNRRFEHYQETTINKRTAGAVIVEMYRRGIVNTSRLGKVIEQYDEPAHDFGGRTAWRLFNATTEALKGSPVFDMPTRTMGLQALLDEATNLPKLTALPTTLAA